MFWNRLPFKKQQADVVLSIHCTNFLLLFSVCFFAGEWVGTLHMSDITAYEKQTK